MIEELKILTRDQEHLIQMQTRLVNQFTACLKASYPVALSLVANLQHRSTLCFLQAYPTPQAALGASVEPFTPDLKQAGHQHPPQVADKGVEQLHQPHLPADPITTRTTARLLLALVAHLLPLLDQSAAYDEESAALF